MEENPAYQSVDTAAPSYQAVEPPQYENVVGVTSSDVQMEENPAYQSIDTAV